MVGAAMPDDYLEKAFTEYLQSNLDPRAGIEVGNALQKAELLDEALALRSYLQKGPESVCLFHRPPWENRRCTASSEAPSQAQVGDLWLDIVEMNVAVLVPNRPGTHPNGIGWLSTRPVREWQFRTFLKLARLGAGRTMFPVPPDYLRPDRFQGPSAAYVTDLYHDEASAYSAWFGKMLCTQMDLSNAQSFLQPAAFEAILPKDMLLWDSSEDIEELRFAFCQDTLGKTPGDEVQKWMRREKLSHPDRMVYGEWERNSTIGLSTIVLQALKIDRKEKTHTTSFDLENTALTDSCAKIR